MSRTALLGAGAVVAHLLGLVPAPLDAQDIRGQVVLTGWGEPVISATVQLLDSTMAPISSTETDVTGTFRFTSVRPGSYFLQAMHGDQFSTLEGPIELTENAGAKSAKLTMRSELYERALACLDTSTGARQGVLAGVAYDVATDIPIPGARVVVEWPAERGSPSRLRGEADATGRFVLCEVPAGIGLTVWVESLGRASQRERDLKVQTRAVARLDMPLRMTTGSSLSVLGAQTEAVPTEQTATVEGRLLDAETDTPVHGAEVRLAAHDRRTLTDAAGRFRFTNVAPGETAFGVYRLGYEWESRPVEVLESASMVVELRAAPRAVELDAIVVRASTAEARMARAATQAPRVIAGRRLRQAEERTAPVAEVIRQFPSLRIQEGQFETSDGVEYGHCVESSRAMHRYAVIERETNLPWCESIAVVVDGVITIRGLEMLHALPLLEVESIEFLPPLGALRWGQRAAVNGALVIWTRGRGPHQAPERDPDG